MQSPNAIVGYSTASRCRFTHGFSYHHRLSYTITTKVFFLVYPHSADSLFHGHHTTKVLPLDAILANVVPSSTGWALQSTSNIPDNLWWNVTSQSEIESTLLAWNKQHLEQTQHEGGQSTTPPISHLQVNHGFNPLATTILTGDTTEYILTPELLAFFQVIKLTPAEASLTPVAGIPKMFN